MPNKCDKCGTLMIKDESSIYNLSPYANDEYCPKCNKAQQSAEKREGFVFATIGFLFKTIIFIVIIIVIVAIVKFTWKILP